MATADILAPQDSGNTDSENKYHPAAHLALAWINRYLMGDPTVATILAESFANMALEGNEIAEISGDTLRRILSGESVSDCNVLGLAWTIRDMEEMAEEEAA